MIAEFHIAIQKPIQWAELKETNFAMWFPCAQDPLFAASPIIENWSQIYSCTSIYWSYMTADLLKVLQEIDDDTFRMSLPDEFMTFPFLTLENEQVILSLSQEKGIRLHFAETTSFAYRAAFVHKFLVYCQGWKKLVDANHGELDEDLHFADWWNTTVNTSSMMEKSKPLSAVGKIV